MVSKKPRVKKVSEGASRAYEEKLRSVGVNLHEANWKKAFPDGLPTLSDFTRFWKDALEGREDGTKLVAEIAQVVAEHPVEGEDTNPINPNATYIEDALAFRQSLSVSADPGPIVQWNDLPTPKF